MYTVELEEGETKLSSLRFERLRYNLELYSLNINK